MGGFLFQCCWLEVTVLIYEKWISHFISERSIERSNVDVEAVHKQASERIKYSKRKNSLVYTLTGSFSGGGF